MNTYYLYTRVDANQYMYVYVANLSYGSCENLTICLRLKPIVGRFTGPFGGRNSELEKNSHSFGVNTKQKSQDQKELSLPETFSFSVE